MLDLDSESESESDFGTQKPEDVCKSHQMEIETTTPALFVRTVLLICDLWAALGIGLKAPGFWALRPSRPSRPSPLADHFIIAAATSTGSEKQGREKANALSDARKCKTGASAVDTLQLSQKDTKQVHSRTQAGGK